MSPYCNMQNAKKATEALVAFQLYIIYLTTKFLDSNILQKSAI